MSLEVSGSLYCMTFNAQASRKYLLTTDPINIPFHHEDFEVEKVYLHPEKSSESLLCLYCWRLCC